MSTSRHNFRKPTLNAAKVKTPAPPLYSEAYWANARAVAATVRKKPSTTTDASKQNPSQEQSA